MARFKIQKTSAYEVNLLDQKGDRLMSETQVNTLIDDKLGAVIDSLGLGHFLGVREKLELHTALKNHLAELSEVAEMVNDFAEAKADNGDGQ